MAISPKQLPGYVDVKDLEKYIDNCLKTGKYTTNNATIFIDIPINLLFEDLTEPLTALEDKYLAKGWRMFDVSYSAFDGTLYAIVLRA